MKRLLLFALSLALQAQVWIGPEVQVRTTRAPLPMPGSTPILHIPYSDPASPRPYLEWIGPSGKMRHLEPPRRLATVTTLRVWQDRAWCAGRERLPLPPGLHLDGAEVLYTSRDLKGWEPFAWGLPRETTDVAPLEDGTFLVLLGGTREGAVLRMAVDGSRHLRTVGAPDWAHPGKHAFIRARTPAGLIIEVGGTTTIVVDNRHGQRLRHVPSPLPWLALTRPDGKVLLLGWERQRASASHLSSTGTNLRVAALLNWKDLHGWGCLPRLPLNDPMFPVWHMMDPATGSCLQIPPPLGFPNQVQDFRQAERLQGSLRVNADGTLTWSR